MLSKMATDPQTLTGLELDKALAEKLGLSIWLKILIWLRLGKFLWPVILWPYLEKFVTIEPPEGPYDWRACCWTLETDEDGSRDLIEATGSTALEALKRLVLQL